MELLTY